MMLAAIVLSVVELERLLQYCSLTSLLLFHDAASVPYDYVPSVLFKVMPC